MTGRKNPPSTYDQMMAEVEDDDGREEAIVTQVLPRGPQRAEQKVVQLNPHEQEKKNTKRNSPRIEGKKNPDSDEEQEPASSTAEELARRRSGTFPPAMRKASSRRSSGRSHNDQDESDDDPSEDEEKEARIRHHGGGDGFSKATAAAACVEPKTRVAAAGGYTTEMNMLRLFLIRPLKPGIPSTQCVIERDRQGLHRLHPIYRLFREDGKQFLACAQKRTVNKTSNYLVTMNKTPPTDRRSALVVAKLRANWSGSEYTIFDDGLSPNKTALEANVRNVLGLVEFAYDEMGPGRLNVRIPAAAAAGGGVGSGVPIKWKDPGLVENTDTRKAFSRTVDKTALLLRNKRPQFDAKSGGHVLDFHGRVTMPSIKNFQMQSDSHGDETVLQFGRISCQPPGPRDQCKCHKDSFIMDVRHPLSPVQAFAICLATLDSKVADGKTFESVGKLLKFHTRRK